MPFPTEKLTLSTVVPVYRGEKYLRELVERLLAVRDAFEREDCPVVLAEAIFVDGESVDGSSEVLARLQAEYPWVKIIQLSRNFGQHPATVAGILHSSGDWVATLDEDLQHPPEKLLTLLECAVSQALDVVYVNPDGPIHGSVYRDGLSRAYKRFLGVLSRNPHVSRFNSFRMLRGSVARAAAALSGHETYLDVALCWFTDRIGSVSMPLKDIRFLSEGESGYNFRSLLSHARRLLLSSQIRALRLGTLIGVAAVLVSFGMIGTIVMEKVFLPHRIAVPGWATTVIWILFFGGLISCLIGIALEYISILVHQAQGRPTFLVVDRSKDRIYGDWLRGRRTALTSVAP